MNQYIVMMINAKNELIHEDKDPIMFDHFNDAVIEGIARMSQKQDTDLNRLWSGFFVRTVYE